MQLSKYIRYLYTKYTFYIGALTLIYFCNAYINRTSISSRVLAANTAVTCSCKRVIRVDLGASTSLGFGNCVLGAEEQRRSSFCLECFMPRHHEHRSRIGGCPLCSNDKPSCEIKTPNSRSVTPYVSKCLSKASLPPYPSGNCQGRWRSRL